MSDETHLKMTKPKNQKNGGKTVKISQKCVEKQAFSSENERLPLLFDAMNFVQPTPPKNKAARFNDNTTE